MTIHDLLWRGDTVYPLTHSIVPTFVTSLVDQAKARILHLHSEIASIDEKKRELAALERFVAEMEAK